MRQIMDGKFVTSKCVLMLLLFVIMMSTNGCASRKWTNPGGNPPESFATDRRQCLDQQYVTTNPYRMTYHACMKKRGWQPGDLQF